MKGKGKRFHAFNCFIAAKVRNYGNGDWGFHDYFGLEAIVELTLLGVSVPMATIYKRIQF